MMKEQGYHGSFTANVSPREAFENISRVSEWWSKNLEGKSQKPNDVFTVRFRSGDLFKAKVSELLPGTKIIWEVTPQKDSVEVKMTHVDLVPELECFDHCTKSWHYLMQDSLLKFL